MFAVLLLAPACELDENPSVGAPLLGKCSNADSDPAVVVSFSTDVHPLMTRPMGGCTCHQGKQTSGLDISSYASLRRGGINSGEKIIVAGAPCDSILPHKIGPTPAFGSRMPLNGPPYLSDDEIQLIRDWIAEGARDN
jgi:hypothetical protein